MKYVSLLFLLGCAAQKPGMVPADPPAPRGASAPTPAPVIAGMLDEATTKSKTHAWLDAYDRADLAGVQDTFAPGFVEFTLGRWYDAKWIGAGIQARIDRHAPVR